MAVLPELTLQLEVDGRDDHRRSVLGDPGGEARPAVRSKSMVGAQRYET